MAKGKQRVPPQGKAKSLGVSKNGTAANKPKQRGSTPAQNRARLNNTVRKYLKKNLPLGDTVIFLNVPASRQGRVTILHSRVAADTMLAVVKAADSTLPYDPRLEAETERLEKIKALVEGETAGTGILVDIKPPTAWLLLTAK
jgi:hypothetical protein